MYYYRLGKDYIVKGIKRKLIGFESCVNEGKDEVCRGCCGKLRFDNGEVICGWMENAKLDWVPMCPEENDQNLTGLDYDENGKIIYDEKNNFRVY